jgi:superfamily II DNA or RNA helicase
MRESKIDKFEDLKNGHLPCEVRVEEVMSDRPRKFSGTENPNVYIGTYQSLEKWPKKFFEQFHTIATDEAHGAKAKTITSILESTFNHAYSRFGVSGTFPLDETCEILTIQSVLGPKITEVSADELKKKGIITPMEIRAVIMNHNDPEFSERLKLIRKAGDGKSAFDFEKAFAHQSDKRLEFIKKIVDKCDNNTLLLFHTIENGQRIFQKLKDELPDKEFFYIDGEVSGKKREIIKKQMEVTKVDVEYTLLNFGEYEIEFKSDFKVLLSNGTYKLAKDIDSNDDINDKFIKKYRK